jgi:hypothetical protein
MFLCVAAELANSRTLYHNEKRNGTLFVHSNRFFAALCGGLFTSQGFGRRGQDPRPPGLRLCFPRHAPSRFRCAAFLAFRKRGSRIRTAGRRRCAGRSPVDWRHPLCPPPPLVRVFRIPLDQEKAGDEPRGNGGYGDLRHLQASGLLVAFFSRDLHRRPQKSEKLFYSRDSSRGPGFSPRFITGSVCISSSLPRLQAVPGKSALPDSSDGRTESIGDEGQS